MSTLLAPPTDTTATAIIDAALWLRERVTQKGLASLSLTFREQPITVTYTAGAGATVAVADTPLVLLTDADLDAEKWVVA